MSEIVYLLILAGVYSVVFVVKQLAAKHDDVKGTPVGGEVFPRVEVYNPSESEVYDECPVCPKPLDVPEPAVKQVAVHKTKYSPIAAVQEATSDKTEKEKISLKSRSEAKRAFIHAEILKRKY